MAQVIRAFSAPANARAVARQGYELAEQRFMDVMARFDATRQECVDRFEAARDARDEAYQRYMAELSAF